MKEKISSPIILDTHPSHLRSKKPHVGVRLLLPPVARVQSGRVALRWFVGVVALLGLWGVGIWRGKEGGAGSVFEPFPVVPPPGSPVVLLKEYGFERGKIFEGEVWVQNIAFEKTVSVFWSTPSLYWSESNSFNASFSHAADNGYEVWRFGGFDESIGFGSQFYVKYDVAGKTFFDNNGGEAFNYALDYAATTVKQPPKSTMNSCNGKGLRYKLYTSGVRYLVVEMLSDTVMHFEVSEQRKPNRNLKIFNSPMVDEEYLTKRFCGPTSFFDRGNVIETPSVKVTIHPITLAVTVFDKVKNVVLTTYSYSDLSSGEFNSFENPSNLILHWTRELTENIYGVAASPWYGANAPLTSEGDWINKTMTAPTPFQGGPEGFGNTMSGVQEGAMVYAQLPVVYNVGSNGYQHAFFLDDQHRLDWDLTGDVLRVSSRGARAVRWFAIAGKSLVELRRSYLKITGPMAVPPKSAFGLHVSKYGYKNWGAANFEVDGIVGRGFPLEAVIYDLYWFGGTGGGFGRLAWDSERFPDPTANLKALRAKGPGAILIEEPYIDFKSASFNFFKNNGGLALLPNGEPATLIDQWWGSGSYIDHTSEGGIGWATCKRCRLIQGCVSPPTCPTTLESTNASSYIYGHWQDLGEPEIFVPDALFSGIKEDDGQRLTTHRSVANIYQLLKTKRTWELYSNQSLLRRPVSLTRTVAPGIQRFGGLTWSGDIPSYAPAVAASFGVKKDLVMAGIEMHSSDIGGFHRKGCREGCDIDKLYTVWFASSVWLDFPIRAHVNAEEEYAKSFTASPAVMGHVPSNLFNTQIRYFLLPLFYSLAHAANRHGDSILTPLFLRYPNDRAVREFGNQYLIGPIMVAYTVETNKDGRGVYFPVGTEWYNFHTHERMKGDGRYSEDVRFHPFGGSLFTIPAFVASGSIFPTAFVDEFTKNSRFCERRDGSVVQPMQVRVYPGVRSTFIATDDDGETRQGDYATTELVQELVGRTASVWVKATKGYFPGQMTRRQLVVEVVLPAGIDGVKSVFVDGKRVEVNEEASARNAVVGYRHLGYGGRIVGVYGSVKSIYVDRTVVVKFK
ncbi:hypothetical protein HDU67_006392 [Dinochytrium kinnereticum]|nr:hypothetical protein HDU67_006392 [Dinochytrium kinnereticum]